jgi:hypothetical protein
MVLLVKVVAGTAGGALRGAAANQFVVLDAVPDHDLGALAETSVAELVGPRQVRSHPVENRRKWEQSLDARVLKEVVVLDGLGEFG